MGVFALLPPFIILCVPLTLRMTSVLLFLFPLLRSPFSQVLVVPVFVVPAVATPVPAVPVLVAMALAVMDLAAPIVAGPTLFKTPPLL